MIHAYEQHRSMRNNIDERSSRDGGPDGDGHKCRDNCTARASCKAVIKDPTIESGNPPDALVVIRRGGLTALDRDTACRMRAQRTALQDAPTCAVRLTTSPATRRAELAVLGSEVPAADQPAPGTEEEARLSIPSACQP